jgi:hypothetical protein
LTDFSETAGTSQGVANGLVEIPISFEVVSGGLLGDYNDNGKVDAADYVVWRKGLGSIYAQSDYDVWRAHFGQTDGSAASQLSAVPEPITLMMLIVGLLPMVVNRAAVPERYCSTLLRRHSVKFGLY